MLPWLLSAGAAIDLREDRWLRATARASEATELARHTDQGAPLAWALYHEAWVEAFRSDEVPCRAHAAEALEIARALEVGSIEIYVAALLGVLESGLGNFRAAADHFDECARRAEECGLGQPEVVQYEPELVEAFHAAGRDPALYVERLQRRAERTGSPWALATAARCRGLLADDTGIDSAFAAALALHDALPSEFERARTQLCYGERLRRVRRNTDAREHLNEALATFERLGARGWADRARRELHATGISTAPRADAGTFDELTAQELRVVLTVAGGATIREAAHHLFLSPKTIEAHLGRAYRKLGVRNRAEMATKVARLNPQALDTQPSYR
jgi:DNA-binding CsgD family transcriptional regulator